MIRCSDGSLYTGATTNVYRRFKEHHDKKKGAKFLRGKGFLTIAWFKKFANQSLALREEAHIKKLSKKAKEEIVKQMNPLLLKFSEECPSEKEIASNPEALKYMVELRARLVTEYSWAIPTEEALRAIAELSPIVEMGAGTGYWTYLLRSMGVDVIAYDKIPSDSTGSLALACNPWHIGARLHTEVESGTPEVLKKHSDRTLFLCWPPLGDMAKQCLDEWKGEYLVYIGDMNDESVSINANKAFREELRSSFKLTGTVTLLRWPGIEDFMTIWKRQ